MPNQRDKVLVIDDDADTRSLFRDQVLDPKRFEVIEAQDGAEGLQQASANNPDMILLDLVMPGLSGADFLVALKSKGFSGPIIVMPKRGSEVSAIDCFRLGATDYLTKPLREAEALRVIEHGLEEVHLRHERKELLDRLQSSNKQLETRLQALTTLSAIGKSVTSLMNLEQLFDQVMDAAIKLTEADHASLMLYDDESHKLILRAGKNMTLVMQERLGEPVTDDIATLVMTSGEPLTVAGDGLKRFKTSSDVNAVIYAPMSIQGKPVGVLTVGNHRKRRAFDENLSFAMEILVGYAAIGIANARLFMALERRARSMEHAYEELKARDASREKVTVGIANLRQPLAELQSDIKRMSSNGVPHKIGDQLNDLSKRIGGILASVGDLIGTK